jgi:hypothetical protein
MNSIECSSCKTAITENALFCYNCGDRVRCKSCSSILVKNAKFCSSCGTSVEVRSEGSQTEKNTVNYHWTRDEIKCDVSLTNEVGKEGINSLIQNITNHQNLSYKILEDSNINDTSKIKKIEDEKIHTDYVEIEKENITDSEQTNSLHDLPHIKDLEFTLNCSESEWILIYAYYESDFATKPFTRQAVRDKYMTSRKTAARSKNFESNWKSLYKLYFATLNDEQIKFKTEHLVHIQNLITGVEKGATRSIAKSKKSRNKSTNEHIEKLPEKVQKIVKTKKTANSQSYSLETSLNLNPSGQQSLKDFFNLYNSKKTPELVLTIVYYLEKIANHQNIGENTIYTCYKNLALPVPNIRQALNNIHNRQGFINTSDFSNLKITVAGENHIEHNMEKK